MLDPKNGGKKKKSNKGKKWTEADKITKIHIESPS